MNTTTKAARLLFWIAALAFLVAGLSVSLSCVDQGPRLAPAHVAGRWAFRGLMAETESLVCADTLTMMLTQTGGSLAVSAPDWFFTCGSSSTDTVALVGTGVMSGDSIAVRWATDSMSPCALCWEFTTIGVVLNDSTMIGTYYDWLGGDGRWAAKREGP